MILDNLRKFGGLPGKDKKVVAGAVCGAVVTRIALRVFGFRQPKEFLQHSLVHAQELAALPEKQILRRSRRIADLQCASEHALFFRPSCLEHSLVLQKLLFREGIPAQLRIGGRKDGDEFKAHAWIEVHGIRFDNFDDSAAYVPFVGIGSVTEK